MTKRPLNLLLPMILFGILCMNSVVAKLATSSTKVKQDTNNNCYYGSVEVLIQILSSTVNEFEDAVSISTDQVAQNFSDFANGLGDLKALLEQGKLTDDSINSFINQFTKIITDAGISDISQNIKNGNFNSIINSISSLVSKHYQGKPVYTPDDFVQYLYYKLILRVLEGVPEKSSCVDPKYVNFFDKLKADLNQETTTISKLTGDLTLDKTVLRSRVGLAFWLILDKKVIKDGKTNVDIINLSNYDRDGTLHLVKLYVFYDDTADTLAINFSIGGDIQQTIQVNQKCSDFIFVTLSIEKSYTDYNADFSIRQYISNRRDQFRAVLHPNAIEGALLRTGDKIRKDIIKKIDQIRCSDDPIEIQEDEIEVITQISDIEVLTAQQNLKTNCDIIEPPCDYIDQNGNCIICQSPLLLHAGTCKEACPEGTYEDNNGECKPCGCDRCFDPTTCIVCTSPLVLSNGKCVLTCPLNTFPVYGTVDTTEVVECKPCSEDLLCEVCKDREECKKCTFDYVLDGKCVEKCPDGYFADNNTPKQCLPCTNECGVCGNTSNCFTCKDGYYKTDDNKCLVNCPDGTTAEQDVSECVPCPKYCKICLVGQCSVCEDGFDLVNGNCVSKCPDGTTRINDGSCAPCATHCVHCPPNDRSICNECDALTVRNTNGQCVFECDDGQFVNDKSQCKNCETHCDQCNDSLTCTKCDTGFYLYNNDCVSPCPNGTYENGSVCSPCDQDLNCKTCEVENQCITCPAGTWLNSEKKCVKDCAANEYKTDSSCIPCSENCETCNSTGCVQCQDGYYFKDGICVSDCGDGYTSISSICHPCTVNSCGKCDPDPSICVVCKKPKVNLNGICVLVCPASSFASNDICIPCTNHCVKCDNTDTCIECDAGYALDSNKKCVIECGDNQYKNDNGECVNCINTACSTCDRNPNNCDKCPADKYKDGVNCVDNCPDGKIKNPATMTCDDCLKPCATCSRSNDYCDTCTESTMTLKDGQCSYNCKDGQIRNSNGACEDCDLADCDTCKPNRVECLICKDPKVTDEGVCVDQCPPGKKANENRECIACVDTECVKCNGDIGICDECKDPKVHYNGDCLDNCPTHTYNDNGICKDCTTDCKECNPLLECTDCHGDKVIHNGECKYICPDGTYKANSYVDNSAECLDCQRDNCNQCINEGKECIICQNGTFLYNGECISQCPVGTHRVGDSCVDCDVNDCAVCPSIATCNVCVYPKFLINNLTCGECPSKTTPDYINLVCIPCEAHCLECKDSTTCTKCDTEYQLDANSDCVLVCPDGTTKTPEGKCLPCADTDCIKCDSLNQSICNECKEGTYLYNQECITPCPEGTFANAVTKTCDNCNVDCKTCSNSTTCDECKNKLTPVNGICPPECPSNLVLVGLSCKPCDTVAECVKCSGEDLGICTKCQTGFILFNNDCIYPCPEGYVEIAGPSCKKCPEFCKTCDQNDTCSECYDPRILNFGHCVIRCGDGYTPVGKECEPCPSNCDQCNSNKECVVCSSGFNAQIVDGVTVCIEACINGFYPDNRKCVECTDPQCVGCNYKNECHKCDDGYYLDGDTCVLKCNDGYVPVDGKCEKCDDPYCASCRDKSSCDECKPPRFIFEGNCVSECQAGYIRVNDSCEPCPKDCDHCPEDPDACVSCKYPKVLDQVSGECTDSCEDGSSPWNGVCFECEVPHCKDCYTQQDYVCKVCEDGYKLSFDMKSCDLVCDTGYYPKDGKCQPCIGCAECNVNGDCTACATPLVLQDGKCVNVDCKPGEIKTLDGKCEPCSKDHCDLCPNISECITCRPGYILSNLNECVLVCEDGYYANGEVCQPCLPNCKKCWNECIECTLPYVKSENGSCTLICEKGFVNVDGVCVKCDSVQTCEICHPDDLSICKKCRDGYIKKDDDCVIDCGSNYWINHQGELGNSCVECPVNCAVCENSDSCVKCDDGYYLKQGQCVKDCEDGWVKKDDECIKCTYDRCNQCLASNPAYCPVCQSPYVFVDGTCQIICPPDTFKDVDDKCQRCNIDHCYVCDSLTSCKYCESGYSLLNGICVKDCDPTFVKDFQGNCVPCEKDGCGQCKFPGLQECNNCVNGYLLLNVCYPTCPPGYFGDNTLKICIRCDPTCDTCLDASTCVKCEAPAVLVDNKCVTVCKPNEAKVNDDCVKCSDPHCILCPADPNTCKACDGNTSLYNGTCVSVCPDGYYSSSGQCLPCKDNCALCPSLAECKKCQDGYYLLNGSCVKDCPGGTRVQEPANCVSCVDDKCLKCDGSNACTECKFLIVNGICVDFCPPGYFACLEEKICKPCIDNCQACSNSRECEICKVGFILQNGKCVEKCKDGYIPVSNECEKCTADCKTCLVGDLTKCSECKDGQYLYNNVCYDDNCPDHTYISGNICLPCDPNCKDCVDTAKHCVDCNGNQILLADNTCKDQCPDGMVRIDGECKRCTDPNCKDCNNIDRSICYECVSPKITINGTCVDNCNEKQYREGITCVDCPIHCNVCNSTGCTTCDQGYFFDSNNNCDVCKSPSQVINNKCVPCVSPNCIQCQDGNNNACVVCPENLVLVDGQCLSTCPPGTYKDGQSCKDCEKDCLICTNGNSCDKCIDGKVYIDNQCKDSCPDHYVANDAGVCIPCTDKENCLKCIPVDPSECVVCTGNTIKVNGKCVDVCPTGSFYDDVSKTCIECELNCKVCIGDVCKECVVGYYLKNNDCVKDCDTGYYANPDTGKCEECSTDHCDKCDTSGCIVCVSPLVKTLDGNCESYCQDGSYPVNGSCEKCDTGCEQCNKDGCIKCIEPLRLTNGECKPECPNGQTSNNGVCVPCNDTKCTKCEVNIPGECIECASPKILLQGACVDECTKGTFRNASNECENCDPSCETCTGPDSCTPPCPTGFIFDNGNCINTCPDGKYKDDDQCSPCTETHCEVCKPTTDGDECVRCELPYILRDGNCVEDCPPGTHYDSDKNICTNCPRGCTLCLPDGSCSKCKKDYFLQHGNCDHTCNSGSVGNCSTLKCDACHPSCKSCVAAGSSSCLECTSGYLFQGDKCVFEDNCLEGFYPDKLNGVCQKCIKSHCKSCDNAQSCRECTENHHLKDGECAEDFDIKPLVVGSLTVTPSTPDINGEVVIRDSDLGNPLQETTTLTLFTVVTSLGLRNSLPNDSTSTIVTIISSKLDLSIELGIDNSTDKCVINFRHNSLTHKVVGQDCSDSALDSATHIIASVNLYGDKIHVDIIFGKNSVVNKVSEDFVFPGLTAIGESDTIYVVSRVPESKNQAHSISDVFISSSKASDDIVAKIASQIPVDSSELSCRNAEKCKEENKFIIVTQGYVDENTTLEVNDTALSKINDILTERFTLETSPYSLKDGTTVSIIYSYQDEDSNIADTVALGIIVDKNATDATAKQGVITIPEYIQEWTHLIISTEEIASGTHYTVKITDSNGNVILNKAIDVANELNNPKFFNDSKFVSSVPVIGVFIHLNSISDIKELSISVQEKKDDYFCDTFDKNAHCIKCKDGYSHSNSDKCESINTNGCEEFFSYVQIQHNEIHEIQPTDDTLQQENITLIINFRRQVHAILSTTEPKQLIGIRHKADPAISTILSEVVSSNHQYTYNFGKSSITLDFNQNPFKYITVIAEIFTSTNQASITLVIDGKKSNVERITIPQIGKIVLGDNTKDQINTEFKSSLICKKSLNEVEVAAILEDKPKEVDAACVNADHSSGNCIECAAGGNPTDSTKCNPYLTGYTAEYKTPHITTAVRNERYITELSHVNTEASSSNFLVVARIAVYEAEDGLYNIIKLENENIKNTENTPLHLLSINAQVQGSSLLIQVETHTAFDGEKVITLSKPITKGEFAFVSVEFQTDQNKVIIISDLEDKPVEINTIGAIEKLQPSAQLSLFGIRTPEDKNIIAQVIHTYLVPNVNDQGSKITDLFRNEEKYLPIIPSDVLFCDTVAQDGTCLKCSQTFEISNGKCEKAIQVNSLDKGYYVITEGITTSAAVSHSIRNPFPPGDFTLSFYVKFNYVKYDSQDKLIEAGPIKFFFTENEGTIVIKIYIDENKNLFGPYTLPEVQKWLSVVISLSDTNTYIYIRDAATGAIIDSTIVTATASAPDRITINNPDNSKFIANVHLTQENYSKPVLPAPEDKSINCDLSINSSCISADFGLDSNGQTLPHYIDVYNFVVAAKDAPATIDIDSILRPESTLSSEEFTVAFNVKVNQSNLSKFPAFIDLIKIQFAGETGNYIEIKTNKANLQEFSVELKSFYTTMKLGHKQIDLIELPREPVNDQTAIIISVNNQKITVLIYNSPSNYASTDIAIEGNLDNLTSNAQILFGDKIEFSNNVILSITDLSIEPEYSASKTEMFNIAVEITDKLQEACEERDNITNSCSKCETDYSLISDNNGDKACVPKSGISFAYNVNEVVHVTESSPVEAVFHVGVSVSDVFVSVNVQNTHFSEKTGLFSVQLDKILVLEVFAVEDKLISFNYLTNKSNEINNVFNCSKAKPFQNVVVEYSIVNGVTTLSIFDKMLEDFNSDKSFSDTTRKATPYQSLKVVAGFTDNSADTFGFEVGSILATINTQATINSDEIKLLATNQSRNNNSCRSDLSADGYELCSQKNVSEVEIKHANNSLFNPLSNIFNNFTSLPNTLTYQVSLKVNVKDITETDNVNKNVLFVVDNSVPAQVANSYTSNDIISEATEGSCRLSITNINDRILIVTGRREIEVLDQRFDVSDYKNIEIHVIVNAYEKTIEVRTKADDITFKQFITNVDELEGVNPFTQIYSSTDIEATISLNDNGKPSEVIDCDRFKIEKDHCNIDNCNGCILSPEGKTACLKCSTGHTLAVNSSICLPTTNVVQPGFVNGN